MDPSHASAAQPPPPSTTAETDNPVVALGRKVKSVLGTDQRPSVRIRREHYAAHANAHRPPPSEGGSTSRLQRARSAIGSIFSSGDGPKDEKDLAYGEDEFDPDMVDLLDVVDPEVSTLSTLTNVQNSLFVPQLGNVVNRRPTYTLSERPTEQRLIDKLKAPLKQIVSSDEERQGGPSGWKRLLGRAPLKRSNSITSEIKESRYAVLPHGETLEGWTAEEKEELDDLVRHMLHSRRAKFKRSMKGFLQYVKRPLGLFITVYATLITLFGAAWVLFLIGWISLGSRHDYIINVVDNVLVALFAVIGDGLAPFRAVDTYHMIYIAHYHRKTWKTRKKLGLPELVDHNDLPDQRKEDLDPDADIESLVARRMPRRLARRVAPRIPKKLRQRIARKTNHPSYQYTVLTEEQQAKLEHHERKFSKSHTFYKPHETETHYAFPLKLLVAVVLLLDLHSCLQITLGACTWGISYKTRPFALTTVVLCCSITCNIMGGVLISIGDKRTRKHDVIERMIRQEITAEAKETLERRWIREAEERGEIEPAVRKRIEEQMDAEENEEIKKAWKGVPLLPKRLLGKGEDHREPSLPQSSRRSSNQSSSKSSKTKPKKSTQSPLQPVQEAPPQLQRPQPALRRDDAPDQSRWQRTMRMIRRADLDKS